jgi:hypothetical protein
MTSEQRPPRTRRAPDDGVPPYVGRSLPPRRPYHQRYAYELDDGSGAAGGRLAAVLLAFAVAALIITHGLWQVTAPSPAGRLLRQVLPPLTDLDQTLAANLETLREVAAGQPPDGSVGVPGLPIPVQVTRDEAESDPAQLRVLVLRRMSDAVHQQGASAFRTPGVAASEPTLLSSQWALQRAINTLTAEYHDSLRIPRIVAGVATLLLFVVTVLLLEGPARLIGPGVSVIAGSVFGGLGGLSIRVVALLFYGEDDVSDAVIRLVARDISNTILFVAGTFLVFGVVLTVLGVLARRWDQPEPMPVQPRAPRARPGQGGE